MASDSAKVALGAVPPAEIGSAIFERAIRPYYTYVKASGLLAIWQKSVAQAIGANVKNGAVGWEIREGGEQGELKFSVENHFRAIGDHKLNITTAQRPVIQCGAANSDKKSLEQTMLADGLVEYHLTERALEKLQRQRTKKAIYQSEGFIERTWDAHSGDPAGVAPEVMSAHLDALDAGTPPPPAQPMKSGEPQFFCLGPLDVARDPRAQSWADAARQFLVTRKFVSKFELAARYPEMREKILNLTFSTSQDICARVENMKGARDSDTDLVPLWTLYVPPSVAVPDGRMVILADEQTVFFDGALPFKDIPLSRETPDEIEGTPFGWSPMFDLLGPQEVVSAADTMILSNQSRAVGNIVTDDESGVSIDSVAGNLNIIKKPKGSTLEPLEFPATPAEFFSFKAEKIQAMQALAGTNAVAMGTPNETLGNDSSGTKLAFINETAMRNNSGLEQSRSDAIRDDALGIIHLYRDFGGSRERKVKIAGKARGYLVKSFTSDDLADIDRVKVEIGNPALRTTVGKMAVADKAVELGIIKPGELDKYLHILKEGTAEPLLEVEQSQLLRIRGENEALMEGAATHRALISDPHWKEIPEHLSLLDNPALREPTPEAQAAQSVILGAVQQHVDLFLQMPPWMVLMRGGPEALAMYQQIQMTMAPPMAQTGTPPPAPGEQSGTPPPKSGSPDALNPAGGKAGLPGMPSMPKSPLTGAPTDLGAPPPGAPLQ